MAELLAEQRKSNELLQKLIDRIDKLAVEENDDTDDAERTVPDSSERKSMWSRGRKQSGGRHQTMRSTGKIPAGGFRTHQAGATQAVEQGVAIEAIAAAI